MSSLQAGACRICLSLDHSKSTWDDANVLQRDWDYKVSSIHHNQWPLIVLDDMNAHIYIYSWPLKKKILLFIRERGREGEREGEKHRWVREAWIGFLSYTPNSGLSLPSRHVPWLGMELAAFQFAGWCSSKAIKDWAVRWLLAAATIFTVLLCLVKSIHQADRMFAASFVQNEKSCATREAVAILYKLEKTGGQFGLCWCDFVSLSPSFITEALLWKL